MARICQAQGCTKTAPYIDYCRYHKGQIYRYGRLRPDLDHDRRMESYIVGDVGSISITRGYWVKCDRSDFPLLNAHRWVADVRKKKRRTSVYAYRTRKRSTEYLHRFLFDVTDPTLTVDHINGDTLDNRRKNLRVVSYSANQQNKPKRHGTVSRYIGVSKRPDDKSKWRSRIRYNCREVYLGTTSSEIDAAIMYDAAAQFLYGTHARINGV